ncbi:MAG: hypothetical protein KKA05_01800, partial [Alphaproteobacteria bacterium]|nr:hypothetical protein [Alphaproteobacteria bacterium]
MAISGAGFGRSLRDAFGAAVGGFDATVNGFVDIVTAPLWAPDYNDPATFNALLDDVYVRGERADYEVSALLVAAVRDKNMTVETLGMLLHNYVTAHIDVMATPHSFDDVPALELLKVLDADRVKIAPAMQNTIARHVLQHAIDSDHYQNVGLVYKILKWHFPDSLPPMAAALDTFATRHEDALAAMIVPGVAFDENSPLMTALQDIEDYTHRYNGVGRAAAAMIEAAQSQAMPELAAAIFQKIKTDTRKVLCANYMVPAMAAGLARQFLAGPFDACAYNHNDPADLMSDPDIVALRSYDQLIEQVGSYLTADARSLNESRKRIAHDGLQARLPAIDEFFAQDKIAMALSRLEVMVKSLRPDQKTIRDYA